MAAARCRQTYHREQPWGGTDPDATCERRDGPAPQTAQLVRGLRLDSRPRSVAQRVAYGALVTTFVPTLMNVFDPIPGTETFVVRHTPIASAMI